MADQTPGNYHTTSLAVLTWVESQAKLCQPDRVFWCDDLAAEKNSLTEDAVAQDILIRLNPQKLPGCYYHRSNPNDVARVEQCTFICTETEQDAGLTNNWMAPPARYAKLRKEMIFQRELLVSRLLVDGSDSRAPPIKTKPRVIGAGLWLCKPGLPSGLAGGLWTLRDLLGGCRLGAAPAGLGLVGAAGFGLFRAGGFVFTRTGRLVFVRAGFVARLSCHGKRRDRQQCNIFFHDWFV